MNCRGIAGEQWFRHGVDGHGALGQFDCDLVTD